MSDTRFDLLTRGLAHSITRRGSLMTLGGTAVAALAAPLTPEAAAKRTRKRKKRRCRRNVRKTCKRQVRQCHAFLEEEYIDPRTVDAYRPCCNHFARCNARRGIDCLFIPL